MNDHAGTAEGNAAGMSEGTRVSEGARARPTAAATDDLAGSSVPHFRVAVIGAGFAGLGTAIRLKQEGVDDFVVLERAGDVGGAWRDNTYPGCACDVPSNLYSFSFAPNPDWSRSFSPQPEIWDYLRRCAKDYGVIEHIRFGHEVGMASWDDERCCWHVATTRGTVTARLLVGGMGPLSEPAVPAIPGMERFRGRLFHSANWDHDHDLTGKRVAVIGTGASAIQFVPEIQPRVETLYVFQRTPPWVVPRPDRPLTGIERRLFRRLPLAQQVARTALYWARETMTLGLTVKPGLMRVVERLARRHLSRQVTDSDLRGKLTPDYTIGCKRILLSSDYYPALARPGTELITDGVREIREDSIVTADGTERQVDTIILGTGFHVTDNPAASRVRGRGGWLLADAWRDSQQAHRGTTIAGFPNFFMLVGPNTGLGHTSQVFMIECQIAYVLDCLRYMEGRDVAAIEVRRHAQQTFNEAVQSRMRRTVWTTGGCVSWYLDSRGRNTTLWPGSTWRFRLLTRRFDPENYAARAFSSGSAAPGAAAAAEEKAVSIG